MLTPPSGRLATGLGFPAQAVNRLPPLVSFERAAGNLLGQSAVVAFALLLVATALHAASGGVR